MSSSLKTKNQGQIDMVITTTDCVKEKNEKPVSSSLCQNLEKCNDSSNKRGELVTSS